MFTKELVLITPNLDLKNENESRYVWLCNSRIVINRMQELRVEVSSIHVEVFK